MPRLAKEMFHQPSLGKLRLPTAPARGNELEPRLIVPKPKLLADADATQPTLGSSRGSGQSFVGCERLRLSKFMLPQQRQHARISFDRQSRLLLAKRNAAVLPAPGPAARRILSPSSHLVHAQDIHRYRDPSRRSDANLRRSSRTVDGLFIHF